MPNKSLVRLNAFIAGLVLCLAAGLGNGPAFCQPQRAYSIPGNRIVSFDDQSKECRSVVLHMASTQIADRPVFKYLAGEGGDTILTADFPGLAWNAQTKIIRLNSSEKGLNSKVDLGIKEVRVGQFADSPPVLRISFVAHDPHLLKSVAIAAGPGVLKVTWGPQPAPAVKTAKISGEPPLAPAISRNAAAAAGTSSAAADPLTAPASAVAAPSAAGPASSLALSRGEEPVRDGRQRLSRAAEAFRSSAGWTEAGQGAGSASGGAAAAADKYLRGAAGGDLADATAGGLNRAAGSVAGGAPPSSNTLLANPSGNSANPALAAGGEPPPTISLVPCDNLGSGVTMEVFRVEMPAGHKLNFKSFRLHNPERYVMDIPDCPSLAAAVVPDVSSSSLVRSLRVGAPEGAEGTGRLVLELADREVNVADTFNPGNNYLSITLGKGLMMGESGGQTNERFSSGEISPGPIIVPRAPDETVVVLDAGHGGTDPGAMRENIQEKDITLGIIEKLSRLLESKGARVVLTRHDDTFVSLEDRVKITNQVGPNLFLSVHINSLETTSNIYGIETYFQTDLSRPLAERVHASLVAGLGAPDRNIRRARFYVINHTPVPAILAEVGYITNKAERDRLISSDYQEKVASALARGVMLYLQDTGVSAGQLAHSTKGRAQSTQ